MKQSKKKSKEPRDKDNDQIRLDALSSLTSSDVIAQVKRGLTLMHALDEGEKDSL